MNIIRTSCVMATATLLGWATSAIASQNESPDQSQDTQQQTSEQQNADQQRQQNSQDQQSQSQPEEYQYSQRENQSRLTGVVQVYREINVDGTPHFRARVSTAAGQVETVDLGPSEANQDLIDNVEQGDRISVQGHVEKMDGKRVFVASRVRLGGDSYTVAEAGGNQHAAQSGENQAKANSERENNEQSAAQSGNKQHGHEVVLLDERFVFYNEGDLNRHLILARENLRMGDTQAAAGELRVAADRIDMYGKAAQGRAARDLNDARQELSRLSDQVARGNGNLDPEQINQAAARAQVAMAEFYDRQAGNGKGRAQSIEAGYALQSAALHAKQALMWSNENIPNDAARSIRQAMRTADDLISGNQQQAGNVTQVAQNLSRQIAQIDQQINEGQAQPASAHLRGEQNQDRSREQQNSSQSPATSPSAKSD